MPGKQYTTQELYRLLLGFKSDAPLSELEAEVGRPALSVVNQLRARSLEDPKTWNPAKVARYQREQMRQWFPGHMDQIRANSRRSYDRRQNESWLLYAENINTAGYAIQGVELVDSQLRICIKNDGNLDMECAMEDFNAVVTREKSPKLLELCFSYDGTTLIISLPPHRKRTVRNSARFLEAYKLVLEQYI